MNNKSGQTLLYSAVGVGAMALILIAVNVIGSSVKQRIDLTKEKSYTLSEGTKAILTHLDSRVRVRFYCSQPETATPDAVYMKNYAKQVDDMLEEYKQIAGGKMVLEKLNPEPDSDAEESAKLDGLEGAQLRGSNEKFYLGVAVSVADEKQALPFLDPTRERLLEYDLSRAISRVNKPERPVVGIMSAMPLFGMSANPMMMQQGQQAQQPWAVIAELKNDFNVKRISMEEDKIDEDVKVLLVIHPREITDKAQYAIDQFIMRGGKLIAFLDPLPMTDSREQNGMGAMPNKGSSLDKLLTAWGLSFDTSKVVADRNFKMQIGGRNGEPQEAPAVLSLTAEGINDNDIATSQITSLWLPYAGAFVGTPVAGLKETVLLKSTKASQLVEGMMANFASETILKEFKPSGTEYALAVKLTGKFKTAFPKGKPGDKADDAKTDADKKAADAKPGDTLMETKSDNAVILVGDADMLYDRVAFQQVQTIFGPTLSVVNGNMSFLQNATEQMTGDNNLIAVRSRATQNRPFTKIKAMETVANEKFQIEIKRLEEKSAEAQRRVNELQQKKDKSQRFILSKEQSEELAKLRKDEVETNKNLKKVQKDLRKEVVSLQTWLKWINILAVPVAVTASGLAIAVIKRRKTSAK